VIQQDDCETKEITLPISRKVVVIKEGNGYSFRALIKRNKRIFESIYDYLASMVVSIDGRVNVGKDDVLKLLLPDVEFLSIEVYKLCYGDIFDFDFTCPSCGKTNGQEFPLDKLEFVPLADGLSGPDPIISIKLPRAKVPAIVGMLTAEKELELLQQAATTGTDLNQGDFKSLRALDGDITFSFEDVIRLKLADHKAIRKARNKLIAGYDPTAIITCPDCEEQTALNVLLHKDFLFPAG
jgi:hypothetical protein